MAVQIQFRNDTAQNWADANPILAVGEMGVETDNNTFKIGDGETAWSDLGYLALPGAGYDFTWDLATNFPSLSAPASPVSGQDYLPVYGQFGKAFTAGNYVRYYYDIGNYPNAWVEGTLGSINNPGSPSESADILIESWGSEFPGFSSYDGTNSKLMLASKAGVGYQYNWNFAAQPYLPNFSDTPYVGETWYIPGPFGAFKNGDYVRLYLDPWNDYQLTAWVEGELSNMSSSEATLTFARWSDAAVGYPGAMDQGQGTTSPYMTLVGKPGVDGDDGDGYEYGLPSSVTPGFGVNFLTISYGSEVTVAGLFGKKFGEGLSYPACPYVRVTFSSGDWIEGLISVTDRSLSSASATIFVEKFSGVSDYSSLSMEVQSVTLVARNVTDQDAIFGDSSSLILDAATIIPGTLISLYGNTEAYHVGDYVRFSIDATDGIEGVVTEITESVSGQYNGNISISINRWYLQSPISIANSNIFVDYPNAKIRILVPDAAGYSNRPALATAEYNNTNTPPIPIDLLTFQVGDTYDQYMEVGAYRVGDYVRLSYREIPYWAESSYPALTIPETTEVWFEGTIIAAPKIGTESFVRVSIEKWNVPQEVIDNGGEFWAWWSVGLAGRQGEPGTPGAGYDYVYPFDISSFSPGMPGDYQDGTPYYVNSSISIPALGAYTVGNFVRYYPNPDVDPTAWVEGQITGTYFNTFDWITISLNNGTASASGMNGVSGESYTIAPYMTLIGEKGDSQILQSLRYVAAATAPFTYFGQLADSSVSSSSGNIFDPEKTLSFNKISSTSAVEIEFDIFATLNATVTTELGEMN
jgi:hypothetical protein